MQRHFELCNQPSFSFRQYLLENLELKQCVVHGDQAFKFAFWSLNYCFHLVLLSSLAPLSYLCILFYQVFFVAKLKLHGLRQAYKLINKIANTFFFHQALCLKSPDQIAYQLGLSYFLPLDMICWRKRVGERTHEKL